MRLVRHVTCHFPNTKVIVFSGRIDQGVRDLGNALGVLELLEKPAGLRRLRDLVNAGLPSRDIIFTTVELGTESIKNQRQLARLFAKKEVQAWQGSEVEGWQVGRSPGKRHWWQIWR